MSILLIKKNLYDRFKLKSLKSNLNESKSQIDIQNRNLLVNILKGTKSLLNNQNKFSGYMKDYKAIISKSTFKSPDIESYPILRKENSSFLPVNALNEGEKKNLKKKFLIKNKLNKQVDPSIFEEFKKRLTKSMSQFYRSNKHSNIIKSYKYQDNNLFLFSDFFSKWNNNDKYSNLNYDEKNIFYKDYTNWIKQRLKYINNNKLENLQKMLKMDYIDNRNKKIKVKLISMKLIFKPIENKNKYKNPRNYNFQDYEEIFGTNNDNKDYENNITLPLSYLFLFYHKGFDYFKNILLATIKFTNDFKNVQFEENEIYTVVKRELHQEKSKRSMSIRAFSRKDTSINPNNNRRSMRRPNYETLKKKTSSNILMNNLNLSSSNNVDTNNTNKKEKKIITFHSGNNFHKNENKKIKYTEYFFIWETPNRTYEVRMIMPMIIFWSEHVKKNIITYCDENLFLFLLQNNFVNWDYYIIHYLFSIKSFRSIILKSLSFYALQKFKNLQITSYRCKSSIGQKYLNINEKLIFLNDNHRVYNQLSDNNESYTFFYTDNFSINSIIDFHSYKITIDYNKLNPKLTWVFILNFKQMRHLIRLSKNENLEKILQKIIITNFEEGKLDIDFSFFNDLNICKINEDDKNNILSNLSNTNINKKKGDDIIINIKNPYVVNEQYLKSTFLNNNVQNLDLDSEFLGLIKNSKHILWSKKILKFMNNSNNNNNNNSNTNNSIGENNAKKILLLKKESSQSISNDDNKIERKSNFDESIVNYHQIKRFSKSLHYKKINKLSQFN